MVKVAGRVAVRVSITLAVSVSAHGTGIRAGNRIGAVRAQDDARNRIGAVQAQDDSRAERLGSGRGLGYRGNLISAHL